MKTIGKIGNDRNCEPWTSDPNPTTVGIYKKEMKIKKKAKYCSIIENNLKQI